MAGASAGAFMRRFYAGRTARRRARRAPSAGDQPPPTAADDLQPVAVEHGRVAVAALAARSRRCARRRCACLRARARAPARRRRRLRRRGCAVFPLTVICMVGCRPCASLPVPPQRLAQEAELLLEARALRRRPRGACAASSARTPTSARPAPATRARRVLAGEEWPRALDDGFMAVRLRRVAASSSAAGLAREPVLLEALAQRHPGPVQDDPQIIRGNRQFLTDFVGFELHHLAHHEDAGGIRRQLFEAELHHVEELLLRQRVLRVAPVGGRRFPARRCP